MLLDLNLVDGRGTAEIMPNPASVPLWSLVGWGLQQMLVNAGCFIFEFKEFPPMVGIIGFVGEKVLSVWQ